MAYMKIQRARHKFLEGNSERKKKEKNADNASKVW